jgi:hypothetical protein
MSWTCTSVLSINVFNTLNLSGSNEAVFSWESSLKDITFTYSSGVLVTCIL